MPSSASQSLSSAVAFARMACMPPHWATCRSLLSLLSLAILSLWLSRRPRHSSTITLFGCRALLALLVCVPPLYVAYRSLLSLLSSACHRSHQLSPLLTSLLCVLLLCLACCSPLAPLAVVVGYAVIVAVASASP